MKLIFGNGKFFLFVKLYIDDYVSFGFVYMC